MSFIDYEKLVPKSVARFVPECFKGMEYVRLRKGDIKTITKLVRSSYQAKDKNNNYEPLFSKVDGSPIMRTVFYIGFDNGTYTSVKYDAIVDQLMSFDEVEEENDENIDLQVFVLKEHVKVKIDEVMQKMGRDSYPVPILRHA